MLCGTPGTAGYLHITQGRHGNHILQWSRIIDAPPSWTGWRPFQWAMTHVLRNPDSIGPGKKGKLIYRATIYVLDPNYHGLGRACIRTVFFVFNGDRQALPAEMITEYGQFVDINTPWEFCPATSGAR